MGLTASPVRSGRVSVEGSRVATVHAWDGSCLLLPEFGILCVSGGWGKPRGQESVLTHCLQCFAAEIGVSLEKVPELWVLQLGT